MPKARDAVGYWLRSLFHRGMSCARLALLASLSRLKLRITAPCLLYSLRYRHSMGYGLRSLLGVRNVGYNTQIDSDVKEP